MRKILILAVALFLLAACTPATAPLDGTTWQLVELGGTNDVQEPGGLPPITVRFEGGQISGSAGCNSYGGNYRATETTITITNLSQTLMACTADEVMRRESAYMSALQAADAYTVDGEHLTLQYAGGFLRFERQ
jgi:heat shock protein HslJ